MSYENLAIAIVECAVKDYIAALRKLKRRGTVDDNWQLITKPTGVWFEKQKIERFFRSEWYACLIKLPGETMINKLREKVQNDFNREGPRRYCKGGRTRV